MSIQTVQIQDAPAVGEIHNPQTHKPTQPWLRWFQLIPKQSPFYSVNTAAGSVAITLPTFSNSASAAQFLNREHLYLKSTSDVNTVTITGAVVGGPVVLNSQGQKARFRFDGKNWWAV
jgi:hypothetical protein